MPGFAEALRYWGRRTSGAVALSSPHGETSYAELSQLADDAALCLALNGVGPGDVVHLPAVTSPLAIATVAAIDRIGAVALITAEDLGSDLVHRLLATSRASVTVTASCLDAATLDVRPVAGLAFASRSALPRDCHLILCTSGSTGDPKLVPLTRTAVDAFVDWAIGYLGIDSTTTVASIAPMNFDISLLDIWATLRAGGTVRLVGAAEVGSASALLSHLDAGVEVVQTVPTTLRLIADAGRTVPGVRHVVSTGEALSGDLATRLLRTFPHAVLHNVYGATETNDSIVLSLRPGEPVPAVVPIGRPIDGVGVRLVDEAGEVVVGEGTGELHVTTPFSTPGYLTDDGLDTTRWAGGPQRERWYRTGDVVRRDEHGLYHCLDRLDRVVKVRGVRTSLASVEAVLAGCDGVRGAAVVVVPDAVAGSVLHAVVHADADLDTLALRARCARQLPRTSLPARYHLQDVALPLNVNGKVDRSALLGLITDKETVA